MIFFERVRYKRWLVGLLVVLTTFVLLFNSIAFLVPLSALFVAIYQICCALFLEST